MKTSNILPMIVFMVSAPTWAEETYLDQLARLQAQTSLMQQEVQLLQLRQQMAASSDLARGLPKIIAVHKVGKEWQARLLLPDGSERTIKKGQRIEDGLKVAAISDQGVDVSVKQNNQWSSVGLQFASSAALGAGIPTSPIGPMGAGVSPSVLPPPPDVALPRLEATMPAPAAPSPGAQR